jgi:hypothetical protein
MYITSFIIFKFVIYSMKLTIYVSEQDKMYR